MQKEFRNSLDTTIHIVMLYCVLNVLNVPYTEKLMNKFDQIVFIFLVIKINENTIFGHCVFK